MSGFKPVRDPVTGERIYERIDPAPTPETVEQCPVCHRIPLLKSPDGEGCARFAQAKRDFFVSVHAEVECFRVGLDARESELSTLHAREQLESAVVEALVAERAARNAIPLLSLKQGEFPSQEFWNANHHLEVVHIDTEKALDALLAHRALKGNADGNC